MSEWIRFGIMICGLGIVTWNTVQTLEYRVDKIETTLDQHLNKHDMQYSEMQQSLKRIEIELTRIQK